MVYYNALCNWVVCHPLYNPTNQGPFFRGSFEKACSSNWIIFHHENEGESTLVKGEDGSCSAWWFGLFFGIHGTVGFLFTNTL